MLPQKLILVTTFFFLLFLVNRSDALPILDQIFEAWDIVQKLKSMGEDPSEEIGNRLTSIYNAVKQSQNQIQEVSSAIESLKGFIEENSQLQIDLNQMYTYMDDINSRAEKIAEFNKHKDYEQSTLVDFANWVVRQSSDSIEFTLEKLSKLFIGPKTMNPVRKQSVLKMLTDKLKANPKRVCLKNQTPQHFLYLFYDDVLTSELQAYTMVQFSWMILQSYENKNYTRERTEMYEDFKERITKTRELVIKAMKSVDNNLWKCNPNKFEIGKTYDEVTRLLQGYVAHERDLKDTCKGICEDTKGPIENYPCQSPYCTTSERCSGKVLNCETVQEDFMLCPSSPSSLRRIQFTLRKNFNVLFGDKSIGCREGYRSLNFVTPWYECAPCMCLCDEQGSKSDRYFNLREVTSNINDNKVVTGLRFKKNKRIFHLQIQEGVLSEKGGVDSSTLRWVPLDNYGLNDRSVKSGVDYHTMTHNNRDIALDILVADINYVITGVRFKVINSMLILESRITKFDFKTGKLLDLEQSEWKVNSNQKSRKEITLVKPDIPIKKHNSSPNFGNNQFIKFTHTDLKKDVMQTTIPFIDIQDVVSDPPVALSGVGLYHKGESGFGGFVAPRVLPYNFLQHLSSETD